MVRTAAPLSLLAPASAAPLFLCDGERARGLTLHRAGRCGDPLACRSKRTLLNEILWTIPSNS